MIKSYFIKINELLTEVLKDEAIHLKLASEKVAQSIESGGIIHLFGSGHSHLLTEEVFFRAGGLVPIRPILIESLMLHKGALNATKLERRNHYAKPFMDEQDIRQNDVVFVISTSGRNPVPIDVALLAKEAGAYVIGITSKEYASSLFSRHNEGKYLYEVVDLCIDNHSVSGDAVLSHEKIAVPFAPTSTVVGATLLNALFAEAIAIMIDHDVDPPIFLSGNLEGADEHNEALIDRYEKRITLLSLNT